MKKIILFTSLVLLCSSLFCTTAKYSDENYVLDIQYNDEIIPGDAIFARMNITYTKNHKKSKSEPDKKAMLQLYLDKKLIETAPFYSVNKRRNNNSIDFLAGIPLSSWLEDGNYHLKVVYSIDETEEMKEFSLPVMFKYRNFDEEELLLDDKNTQIKTDNSPERAAQIDKLNTILFTTMNTDVFSLKHFISPTTSTRYTAHFGDRRKYVYTNGKSSTSLHYGNDYGIPEGTPVTACGEGKVVMAENRISTGWSIVIEHLPGLYSLYYHLSEMNVKEGDYVKTGDLIGKSGSTGLATGPHLHWEVRLNGSAVRPEFFLDDFAFDD